MRCAVCGSGFHGVAGNGRRRVRHSRRPTCSPSATYRAERYELAVAGVLNEVAFTEEEVDQVFAAMRRAQVEPVDSPEVSPRERRAELQRLLAAGELPLRHLVVSGANSIASPQAPRRPPVDLRLRRAVKSAPTVRRVVGQPGGAR
jgi:hypothetical protein